MTNLTSVVGAIEVVVGIVAILFPSLGISATQATVLISTGLGVLGISQKVEGQNKQLAGGKGMW